MNALWLSVSNPSRANANSSRNSLSTSASRFFSRTNTGAHAVQLVAMSVSVDLCTKLPFAVSPLCATRSASTNPGAGD